MPEKHPIIANGELYAEPVDRPVSGGPKDMPRSYDEAKKRIINNLDSLSNRIEDSDEIFLEEVIVCLRLEPSFEAKSYVPDSVIRAMSNEDIAIVGGRKYTIASKDEETSAKLYFVRTTDTGIQRLKSTLNNGDRDNIKQWKQQIQSIHSIDLLSPEEKVMGFKQEWNSGSVEFVLHPLPSDTDLEIQQFFSQSGISEEDARIKSYDDGITFISATCNIENLERAKMYNPLRAAHPMGTISIIPIRNAPNSIAPTVMPLKQKPTIHIGAFDGGADEDIPLLKGYVNAIDGTTEPPISDYLAHGSGVCSAILYGNLSGKSSPIDPPYAMINCYRVLPLHDNLDYDLYEAIDLIESIVPNDRNTKLYNISFGPSGAIVDDSISRFTYALDKLSYEVPENEDNPLFVVAVGNDGELPPNFNRIQAPADVVNGLGVGAYTYDIDSKKVPAVYSCVRPGREGAKTKPDLLDFGGSLDHPFIVPSLDHVSLSATAGTSFAAPVVTGKIGKLMYMSKSVSPHIGRALLIHEASTDTSIPKAQQGFGFCSDDIDGVLRCSDNHVTIMYNGTILPAQYLKLPIFSPRINEMAGKVTISWTVATVVAPYGNDPDAYTNNCLEDVFSPHSMTYNYSKKGEKTIKINLLEATSGSRVQQLINNGYRQSAMPVSHPAKKVWDEEDLRAVDLKWDTVIHKSVTMFSRSLFDPALTLHAIGRNGFETTRIKYHVVITIDAPRYVGSLYDAVLQTYQSLSPIRIKNLSRFEVH